MNRHLILGDDSIDHLTALVESEATEIDADTADGNPDRKSDVHDVHRKVGHVTSGESASRHPIPRNVVILKSLRLAISSFQRSFYNKTCQVLSSSRSTSCMAQATSQRLLLQDISLKAVLTNSKSTTEKALLSTVIQYFSLVNREMKYNIQALQQERILKEKLVLQANYRKEMLLFSRCLALESSNKVSLHVLAKDSSQFIRCTKAFNDNRKKAQDQHGEDIFEHEVLSVIKLQHNHLSAALQTAVTSLASLNMEALNGPGSPTQRVMNASSGLAVGKIKGLFTVVASDQLHRLLAYGLHTPQPPGHPQAVHPSLHQGNVTESWYQQPWYHNHDDCSADSTYLDYEAVREKEQVSIPLLSVSSFLRGSRSPSLCDPLVLHFSKYSTIYVPQQSQLPARDAEKPEPDEGICFMALCRVFVNSATVKTVTHEELQEIVQQLTSKNAYTITTSYMDAGVEALFAPESEEFVFLNPNQVLPEFILQVNMKRRLDISQEASLNRNDKPTAPIHEQPSSSTGTCAGTGIGSVLLEEFPRGVLLGHGFGADGKPMTRAEHRTTVLEKQTLLFTIHDTIYNFLPKVNDDLRAKLNKSRSSSSRSRSSDHGNHMSDNNTARSSSH